MNWAALWTLAVIKSDYSSHFVENFTLNAVFSFSVKPLRLFSVLGLSILGGTGVLGLLYLVMALFTSPPRGITSVLLLLLLNLGVLSLGIGILGEYIAKIYAETKRRPLWLVDYTLNLGEPAITRPIDGSALLDENDYWSLPGRAAS